MTSSRPYLIRAMYDWIADNNFTPYTTGIKLMMLLRRICPKMFDRGKILLKSRTMFKKVTGSAGLLDAIIAGESDSKIIGITRKGIIKYLKTREKYLLYD